MERSDENSISPMTDASSIRGSPMEGVQYPALLDANRRTLRGVENQIFGGSRSAQVIGKRPSQETELIISKSCGHCPMTRQFSTAPRSQLSSIYLPIERQQKRAAITAAENPVDDDSNCTSPMEVIAPLLMAPDVEMGEISESKALEVEMHDVNNDQVEEVPDIDIPDLKYPVAVVEYVEEIHDFYRRSEDLSCVDPNYMSNQSDINERMRGILIDWLIKVHYIFEQREETLFLTVNLIDRFLALHVVTRKRLQLVGVTAFLLACKYEDVTIPFVRDLIFICDGAYTRTDLLQMERLMLNTLQFNISVPTPYVFMKRFLKAAQCYKKLEFLSFFMVELCLVDYNMLQFRPSLLAAAAVFTAQCTLNGFQSWSKCSELHSRYTQEELIECSRMMVQMHHEAADGKLTGVHTKFRTRKFRYASRCKPALFLIHHVPMETEPTSDSEVLNQT